MWKEALRLKMRFATSRGNLTIEQLWDLSLEELDALAVQLKEQYDQSGAKSYLKKRSVKDKKIKIGFDIVLEILETKVEEAEAAKEALETKAHNQKILELIAKKKDEQMEGLSIEELEKQLK